MCIFMENEKLLKYGNADAWLYGGRMEMRQNGNNEEKKYCFTHLFDRNFDMEKTVDVN